TPGGDAVDVRPHVLVGRLRPLERDLDAERIGAGAPAGLAREVERERVAHRLAAAVHEDGQVVGDPLRVEERVLLVLRLVDVTDLEAAVEVGLGLEALLDDARVEAGLFAEDLRIGAEEDVRPALSNLRALLERTLS